MAAVTQVRILVTALLQLFLALLELCKLFMQISFFRIILSIMNITSHQENFLLILLFFYLHSIDLLFRLLHQRVYYITFSIAINWKTDTKIHGPPKFINVCLAGPCDDELRNCRGTPCFMKSLEALEVQCTCLPKIATTEDGRCYQPYTRGPCEYVLSTKSICDVFTFCC